MGTRSNRPGALLLAVTASAASGSAWPQIVPGWAHESASGVEFAYYTLSNAELTVRCKGPFVEVVYYVDVAALDPGLKGKSSAVFAVAIDDEADFRWKSSSLVMEAGVTSIGRLADHLRPKPCARSASARASRSESVFELRESTDVD